MTTQLASAQSLEHKVIDHGQQDHGLPRVRIFAESETELNDHLHAGQFLTSELAFRMAQRFSLGAFALVNFARDGTHFGGGLSVRYETPFTEGLFRIAIDHRWSEFPDNIIRAEVQTTGWIYPNVGGVLRGLIENFPSALNEENGGRWDTVAGAGVSYRPNGYFTAVLLGTARWSDLSHVRHGADRSVELGGMLMVEGIFLLLQ